MELAQDTAVETAEKMPKRELSPSTALETAAEVKRPRLENEASSDTRREDISAYKAQTASPALAPDMLAMPKWVPPVLVHAYQPGTTFTLHDRQCFAGQGYLVNMATRREDPPLFSYTEYREMLEVFERYHDKLYKRDPAFKKRLFDLEIERDLLSEYLEWVKDRRKMLEHVQEEDDLVFYETLDWELQDDFRDVYVKNKEHRRSGLHLRGPAHPGVWAEKAQAAEALAASQAPIDAQSPSSDAYQDCLETTPTSPRTEKSQ